MDKKVLKQIRQFASVLPDVMHDTFAIVSGEEILKHNPKAAEGNGNAINPDAKYKVPAKMKANHYRSLKKAYKEKGINGVLEYAEMMKAFREENGKLLKEVVGGVLDRENEITNGF